MLVVGVGITLRRRRCWCGGGEEECADADARTADEEGSEKEGQGAHGLAGGWVGGWVVAIGFWAGGLASIWSYGLPPVFVFVFICVIDLDWVIRSVGRFSGLAGGGGGHSAR